MSVGSEIQSRGGDQGVVNVAVNAYGIIDETPLSRIGMQFHPHRSDHAFRDVFPLFEYHNVMIVIIVMFIQSRHPISI